MNLNFLECLGIIMCIFIVYFSALCLYWIIKDAIDERKKYHIKQCSFCGVYLHGYQYSRKGAKYDARYCSRCGRALNETENTFDPIKLREECVKLSLSSNEYRERVKRLGCESCRYFRKQCDAMTGILVPEFFENECKYRSVVLRKEKNDED